jgi:hypothetical protein
METVTNILAGVLVLKIAVICVVFMIGSWHEWKKLKKKKG